MERPRHLWSGDWISESANAADELARRREQLGEPEPTRDPEPTRAPEPTREPAPIRKREPTGEPKRPGAAPGARHRRPRPQRRRLQAVTLLIAALAIGATVVLAAGPFNAGRDSAGPAAPVSQSPRPWLGLTSRTSPGGAGALVTQIDPGGPAEQAGLQQGDVITAVNGQQIAAPSNIAAVVDSQLVGNEVLVQINRGGQLQTVGVTLARRPAGAP